MLCLKYFKSVHVKCLPIDLQFVYMSKFSAIFSHLLIFFVYFVSWDFWDFLLVIWEILKKYKRKPITVSVYITHKSVWIFDLILVIVMFLFLNLKNKDNLIRKNKYWYIIYNCFIIFLPTDNKRNQKQFFPLIQNQHDPLMSEIKIFPLSNIINSLWVFLIFYFCLL